MNGKVVLDVATPKQAIFASMLYKKLKNKCEVEVLARKETQTIDLLNILKVPYSVLGWYGKPSIEGKLEATLKREFMLLKHFKKNGFPDVLWSHGSVSGIRIAYMLRKPVVYNNDTLHNTPVVKLTVPYASCLIIPEAYRKSEWSRFGLEKDKIFRFKGVEEIAWIKEYKPLNREKVLDKILSGQNFDRVIVFRGIEYKASYVNHDEGFNVNISIIRNVIKKLLKYAAVIYLPRYEEDRKLVEGLSKIFIPEKPPYAPKLVNTVDLVISSGGTLARESALLGTPTLSFYFNDRILKYLKRRGFNVKYIPDVKKLLKISLKILKNPEKYKMNTSKLLKKLESPIPVTIKHILKFLGETKA